MLGFGLKRRRRKGTSEIVFFLHSNIRSGANLSMLRNAAYMANFGHSVSVVFEHDWSGTDITFVPGHEKLCVCVLSDWVGREGEVVDVAITNWWTCAYNITSIPARLYAYFRHGQEKALYNTPVFDIAIDMLLRENFRWYCVSNALAEDLLQRRQRALVVPNGVDLAAFAAAVPFLPPRVRPLRVLVEGPIGSPFKRVEETIAMLRTLDVEIVHMAADGSRPQMPIDYPLGGLPHQDVPAVFTATDLIVKLSLCESFAMPVLEQFAARGTAIVAAFPGHESYIQDGINALVVDPDDPFPAARAALLRLLADELLLARLRHSAHATALRFSWDTIGAQFLQDLLNCIHAPQFPPVKT